MPRTRNITRAQWDAANASNSTREQNQNRGYESEKENEGRPVTRATRSQTRSGNNNSRVMTTTNLRISTMSKGPENASSNSIKVKGKAKTKAPAPKRKKLPLQDITSQFLPAFEATNRDKGNEAVVQQNEIRANLMSPLPPAQILGSDVLGPTISMSRPAPTYLDSPLPPSSPPSAITSSPQHPKILPNPSPSWLGLGESNNFGDQFSDGCHHGSPSVISSSSDPFGFVALERKLKMERTAAAPSLYHHQDESDEELDPILVADTSSPRLVRRLKRPLHQDTLAISEYEHPHYATPPTPHKKRQRLSHEMDRVSGFSLSSMPSTPSPSKSSVRKRPHGSQREDAPENNLKGNRELEGILGRTRDRSGRRIIKGESTTSKVTNTPLELEASLDEAEERAGPKRAKVARSKKVPKKPRSTGTKKSKEKTAEKNEEGEDYREVFFDPWSRLFHSSLLGIRNGRENDKNALHISSG